MSGQAGTAILIQSVAHVNQPEMRDLSAFSRRVMRYIVEYELGRDHEIYQHPGLVAGRRLIPPETATDFCLYRVAFQ